MALVEVRRFSQILEKQIGMQVLLPDIGEPPYPTLYLLHGLSDDYTGWVRKSRLEMHLRDWPIPMIVVMPDGFRGWYCNNHRGPNYADYLAQETVGYVDRFFPTEARREKRWIGGLSMGGYGALTLALAHPDLFSQVTSHSGALFPWARDPMIFPEREMTDVFGPDPGRSPYNPLVLAQRCSRRDFRLSLDCGDEDLPWLPSNRSVMSGLRELGYSLDYQELPGGHDWYYWERRIPEFLEFHSREIR